MIDSMGSVYGGKVVGDKVVPSNSSDDWARAMNRIGRQSNAERATARGTAVRDTASAIESAQSFLELTLALRAAGERKLSWADAMNDHQPNDPARRALFTRWAKADGQSFAEAERWGRSTQAEVLATVRRLLGEL